MLYAQQQGTEIPNFTPPSPEAAAITQYGNQEINESTGKTALSIPIHTYTVGGISVPIGLNYIGSGVKVNAPNTWTGVNWTLNAGGVITRVVQDDPDEVAQQRITQADIDALGLIDHYNLEALQVPSNNATILRQYFTSPGWDTQPYIFSFSFPGGSGSFYLDENFDPVLITNDNPLKIEITGNQGNKTNLVLFKEFKITIADGTMYYFGGNEVEQTKMEYGWHNEVQPLADTGYYLYRIEHPINGNVFFEYHNISHYKTSVSAMHSAQDYLVNAGAGGIPFPVGHCQSKSPVGRLPAFAPQIVFNNIYNARFLKRMYTNANSIQEVRFNSTTTIDGGFNFERVLESIEIVNNATVLRTIDLDYIFDYEGLYANRFFLTTVDFNDDKKYSFNYNNPLELPGRFSYAQDHYGFYNGALSNENGNGMLPTVPHPLDPSYIHPINTYSDHANRSFNFEKSLYGTLEQIVYPTGGRTTFEYESNLKKKATTKTIGLKAFRNNFPIDDTGAYANDDLVVSATIGGNGPIDVDLGQDPEPYTGNTLLYDQQIEFNLTIHALSFPGHERTYIRVFDAETNTQLAETFRVFSGTSTPNSPVSAQYTFTFPFTFEKDKTYHIELELPNNTSGSAMHANLNFNFINGEQLVNAGSLRVKKQYDQTSYGADATNIKRYYYLPKENVFKDPIDVVDYYQEPSYVKPVDLLVMVSNVYCQSEVAGIDPHPGAVIESSATNIKNEQNLNNYNKVKISYGGDNFENGGIEKQFITELGNITNVFKTPRIETPQFDGLSSVNKNASWRFLRNGKLTKQTVLIYKDDALYKIKETRTNYTNTILSTIEGFAGSFFADIGRGYAMPYTNVGLAKFQIHARNIVVNETVNIDYIDAVTVVQTNVNNPYKYIGWEIADHDNDGIANYEDQDYSDLITNYVPVPTVAESEARKVITTTNYEYNSDYAGLPTKTTVTTSNDNKTYESVSRYLDERVAIANGDTNQLTNYDALHASNRVSSPIQTESYVKLDNTPILLSTQKTVYDDVNTSGNVLPATIQSAKGTNTLEDRVVFVDYDAKGNPTEIQYKNGSITKYKYNGLNQVIQKIENYEAPIGGFNFTEPNLNILCQNAASVYPNSYITLYFYDSTTNLLTHIIDPSCNKMSYEYDAFYRLKYIKDKDGNILSKNEYNYTQN